uniref:ABC transporter domain-containing protein n=1 Tax=Kalanchoe fedtschenkoi TaxID=63787 RepID=A0A7N0TPC8_KALFE
MEDEKELLLAALEKLPTYDRMRTSILKSVVQGEGCDEDVDDGEESDVTKQERRKTVFRGVDVRKLSDDDRRSFIERKLRVPERDNFDFLTKIRERIHRAGLRFPTVEVRFKNLRVEADCYVGTRALPTLLNSFRNIVESALAAVRLKSAETTRYTILKDISGIVRPSRMTLLLGPPSSGKTTLLLALAGLLDPSLKVAGEVSYNGYRLDEFVPQKTSAYISQNDVHMGVLTVKETLDYSARFQGVGNRQSLLKELIVKEKVTGSFHDTDVDLFMKSIAVEGVENSLITDYVLKLLGLDICKDTIVGDEMMRCISGGQKKRVTTGEMIVGPATTLFLDEISTGLDSSTTHQIVMCMQQIAHLTDATIFMSLLQPAPETFSLFDDIILLSEGQIVYHGPRENVVPFFNTCGFQCPERKGTADFLQEVISKMDQHQYWADKSRPHQFISVYEFCTRFKAFSAGQQLDNELSILSRKSQSHKLSLVFKETPTTAKLDLLKTSINREWLIIKRTSVVYVFRAVQIVIVALVASTVFLKTTLGVTYDDGMLYVGAVIFAVSSNMYNGLAELSITIMRLPVFYKQRDLRFCPAWAYTLPNFLLSVPISVMESIVWTAVSYFTIGYAEEAGRFFKQLLVIFLIQQMANGLFKLMAGLCRTMIMAQTGGSLMLLLLFLLGGFMLPQGRIPIWWRWAHWLSPLSYGFKALTVNEMLSPRWMNKLEADGTTKLGVAVLQGIDVPTLSKWYWIGVAALLGFIILFNLAFTYSLMYLNPLGKPQAIIPKDQVVKVNHSQEGSQEVETATNEDEIGRKTSVPQLRTDNARDDSTTKTGMILPFEPLSMCFDSVNYFVDMPREMKEQGVSEDRLQLLRDVTGAFRPGVLTALMGVSGAGKTTLMDVLAGRKTGGYIEGDIRISGHPKKQETFARISGYCEQNDIHSPQLTVKESLIFSAFLRLPNEIGDEQKMKFVEEVMELVELRNLENALVGLPGVTGLSTEQRKRLTISVELVANPSIIFMDEPTSGLDARAAAIVMRTVRNTVDTGRTVVCTIHQPSIDIFEAFDELLLMKRGGQVIYSGSLGVHSQNIIDYFETIPGVPKIEYKQNPAAWMLEASSEAVEIHLGIDFAQHYMSSSLFQQNKALVKDLSTPTAGSKDLQFSSQYSQSTVGQFKSCLWKHWWTYWRTPDYNLVRYFFTLAAALVLGSVFWKVGSKRDDSTDLTMVIGAMFVAILYVGINNCSTVQPIVSVERTVFYRERAAGMYSAVPYAIAQVVAEIPYVFIQTTYFTLIVYSMMSFDWAVAKFMWFFYITFFSFLYFTYYGMMTVGITPNHHMAAIFSSAFYGFFTLFSGFFIPRPRIPKWWIWYYWICPIAWTVYGLIVTQYGDVEDTISVPGIDQNPTVKFFVENHFGYSLKFIGPVSAVLAGYAVLFAVLFAISIKVFNFQQR